MELARDITLVLAILALALFAAYFLWLLATQVAALFCKGREAGGAGGGKGETEGRGGSSAVRFAVVICARNEEKVIARLIESLQGQRYDPSLFDIFVVAHNCTDSTAEVARRSGARVIVLDDPSTRRKADALAHGIREIGRMPATYDAFAFFDADNAADPLFLENAARALGSGADMAQGKYCSTNYHANAVTELSGALWLQTFHAQSETFTRAGLPVLAYGTGFALAASAVDPQGWPTKTLVEDFEMSIMLALRGKKMVGSAAMKTYAEQPTRLKVALEQRKRWAVGDMQCLRGYFLPVVRSIPRTGVRGVKILVDLLLNVALIGFAAGFALLVAHLLLAGFSGAAVLGIVGAALVAYWLLMAVQSLILFRKEGMRARENIATLALFPLWILVSVHFACYSLFVRDVEWKTIPRAGKDGREAGWDGRRQMPEREWGQL